MQLFKTYKTVEEEQAENYERPEFVYDPLFGKAHFNEPGFQGFMPTESLDFDDWSNLDIYDKPVTCVMFSNFPTDEDQFSEAYKIRLRLAVRLVSVMIERAVKFMKPPPENSNITSQEHAAVVNEEDVTFEFQLLRWFGSDSRTTATRVREGILKMHKVLTDPLEIISFVNDIGTQKSTVHWVPRYEKVAINDDDGFIVKVRRANIGYVIYIDDESNLHTLNMDVMVLYIFHELCREILDLPYKEWDDRGYLPCYMKSIIIYAGEEPDAALLLPACWTHFVDALRFYKKGNRRSDVEQPNENLNRHISLENKFAEVCKLSDDSDLYPL